MPHGREGWQQSDGNYSIAALGSLLKDWQVLSKGFHSVCQRVCEYVCECLEEVLSEHIKQYLSLHENQSTASECHTCTRCRRDDFCRGVDSLSEDAPIYTGCDSIHGKTENIKYVSISGEDEQAPGWTPKGINWNKWPRIQIFLRLWDDFITLQNLSLLISLCLSVVITGRQHGLMIQCYQLRASLASLISLPYSYAPWCHLINDSHPCAAACLGFVFWEYVCVIANICGHVWDWVKYRDIGGWWEEEMWR